jgi:hypothetical protein
MAASKACVPHGCSVPAQMPLTAQCIPRGTGDKVTHDVSSMAPGTLPSLFLACAVAVCATRFDSVRVSVGKPHEPYMSVSQDTIRDLE